jgi:hypothetical protein
LLWLPTPRKRDEEPQKVLSFHNCVDDYFSIIALSKILHRHAEANNFDVVVELLEM